MKLKLSDFACHSVSSTLSHFNGYAGRPRRFKRTPIKEHGLCFKTRRNPVIRMNFTVRAGYSSPSDILSSDGNGAFRSSTGSTEFSSSGAGTYDIVEEKATIKVLLF